MMIQRVGPGTRAPPPAPTLPNSNRVVATHLSGYCAYLVACYPDLLPDDDGRQGGCRESPRRRPSWRRSTRSWSVRLLSAGCRHKVLRNGAQLAEQLYCWPALVQSQTQNQQEEEDKV
uniref:Uncharacterized protein n=1 Tax=Oryza rufipogon TaxID=4529 RepID=A0A0E0Q3Q1_ORYRU